MLTRRIFWTLLLITGAIAISTTSAQAQSTSWRSRADSVNRPAADAPERVAIGETGAVAQRQVAVAGAIQGNDTDSPGPVPDTLGVTTRGTGIGTNLGQFSFTLEITVNLAAFTHKGLAHFIANDGNIDATIVGSAELTATPGVINITEIYTITGGTGRFAGARGIITAERVGDGITFTTLGLFHGTISSTGAAH